MLYKWVGKVNSHIFCVLLGFYIYIIKNVLKKEEEHKNFSKYISGCRKCRSVGIVLKNAYGKK